MMTENKNTNDKQYNIIYLDYNNNYTYHIIHNFCISKRLDLLLTCKYIWRRVQVWLHETKYTLKENGLEEIAFIL